MRRDTGREREQPDFAGGVEAEPEQDSERIHVPGLRDEAKELADEEPVHEAAIEEALLEPLSVVGAAAHLLEDAQDVEQDEQVEDADDPEERARDARPDVATPVLEARDARVDRLGGEREGEREAEDDRRVSEREEEAHAERPLLVLQHLPRGVVDRRDVVGVERVPQSERVRQHPEPGKSRAAVDVVEEETPARDVQQRDRRAEAGEAEPFRPSQGLRPPTSAHCVGDSPREPDRFGPGR